jgi:allantoin racemase
MRTTTMGRILIVNPNTTASVTARVLAEAQLWARPGTELTALTGETGASIVSTPAEELVAARAALEMLAQHHAGYDAAILAISFDSGLVASRAVLPIPVIGLTQAALHTAALVGRRIGMVGFGASARGLYRDLIERYGLTGHVLALDIIDLGSVASYLDETSLDAPLIETARRQVTELGVEVVVVAGAAVCGIGQRVAPAVGVPVLDGAGPAVALAEALAQLRLHAAAGPPALATTTASGLSPALTTLLSRRPS